MPSLLTSALKRHLPWALAWLAGSLLAALVVGGLALSRERAAFDADAQTVYGLLGQRLAANDALLASLVQNQSPDAPARQAAEARSRLEQRLRQTHPQVLAVLRREPDASWGDEALRQGEDESTKTGKPALAGVNLARGRYALVQAGTPDSFALQIDFKNMVSWPDWPMARPTSPVRVTLGFAGQSLVLQDGAGDASAQPDGATADASQGSGTSRRGWHMAFAQTLPSASQPFVVQASQVVGWGDLPWGRAVNLALLLALALLATRALLRQRHDRLRAGELLHMGQLGRLNTLSELAGGMTHELEQPLQQALQGIQAAEQDLAHEALESVETLSRVTAARAQVQRASDVVARLSHVVRQPDLSGRLDRISLPGAVRHALDVLQPELRRLGIAPKISPHTADFSVLAEHGALQQVIHNLLLNAMQAMEDVRPAERKLTLYLATAGNMGQLSVQDNGPGMDNRVVGRIFEPFFTTRPLGLGLGLSLCESLTAGMGGTLTAFNRVPRGAEFCLSLRLAA